MSDIKPKNGEIWMVEQAGIFSPSPPEWPVIWEGQEAVKPLYRLSRHTTLNELKEAQAAGKQLQVFSNGAWMNTTLPDACNLRIEPEEKPLIIPWDKFDAKFTKATYYGDSERFQPILNLGGDFEGEVMFQMGHIKALGIDVTNIPDGATAERPE